MTDSFDVLLPLLENKESIVNRVKHLLEPFSRIQHTFYGVYVENRSKAVRRVLKDDLLNGSNLNIEEIEILLDTHPEIVDIFNSFITRNDNG